MSDLHIEETATVHMVNGSGEHKAVRVMPIPLTANAKVRCQPISEERAKPITDRLNERHEDIKARFKAGELDEDNAKRERTAATEAAVAERETIESACEDADRPIYLIRVPTKRAKIEWRAECIRNARPVGLVEQMRAMRKAIGELLTEESGAQSLAVLDEWEAVQKNELGAPIIETPEIEALRENYNTVRNWCWSHSPECADVIAAAHKWGGIFSYETVRHFLAGWERVPAAFDARSGLCTEATLEAIPDAHMDAIANRASTLISLSEGQRKN